MTNPNKSHITLLCDRSGSMNHLRTDAEGAVNKFIDDQKKLPGECTLLLADFDAPVNRADGAWLKTIHDGPIASAPTYTLEPRGMTALFDAMGIMIARTGERLAAMSEADRPGHVFFVIQTDGQENSSVDWKLPFLTETIKQQEGDYNWTFIFLGMGPDAFVASQQFVGTQMINNTTRSANTGAAYAGTYSTASANIGATRMGMTGVDYGAEVDEDGNVITNQGASK